MSAFVVQEKTIHRILGVIVSLRSGWIERELGRLGYPSGRADGYSTRAQLEPLGQDLWTLNNELVNEKYADTEPNPVYSYHLVDVSNLGGYASIKNWLYQCAEGHGPAHPLYRFVEDIKGILADAIIRDLPGYGEDLG